MNQRLWNAYMCISNKVETGGRGTDYSPIEGFKKHVDDFASKYPPEKFKRVLNIGVGGGGESKLLVDAGYDVVAVTLGEDNVKYAKENYGIDAMEFDMHYLNLEPDSIDAIFMIQTQEHALSSWIFALEMYFVLRPEGIIYTDLPSPVGGKQMKTIWHTSVLYPDQWRALMWKAGFKELRDKSSKSTYTFEFVKLPKGEFQMWSYVQHIYKLRYAIYKDEGVRELKWNRGKKQ